MDNYRKKVTSSGHESYCGRFTHESIKPFKDDGFIEAIHYIEEVGLDNVPKWYLDQFRFTYCGARPKYSPLVIHNAITKGYPQEFIFNFSKTHSLRESAAKFGVAMNTIVVIRRNFRKHEAKGLSCCSRNKQRKAA